MPTTLNAETIHEAQCEDEELAQLRENSSLNLQRLKIEDHAIYCDISSGSVRPYIPLSLRRQAFDTIHGLSHPSGRATTRKLIEKFIWPGIKKDALLWARQCIPCQRSKIHRHNGLTPNHIGVPSNRFDHVHLDLIELPKVGELRYCLTIIDRFSRWQLAIPLSNMLAETVGSAFYTQWICQFGTPLTMTTDQGSQFESRLFLALARMTGAYRVKTTPYHPQSNGLVERWHRTLKAALMCNAQIPWPELLPTVLIGLRTAYKEDLKAFPAEMLFGTPLRIPGEFFVTESAPVDPQMFIEKFREHIRTVRSTPTAHHTKSRVFILKDLYNCSHVFKRVDSVRKPLEHPYTGPHEVIRRLNDRNFVIKIKGQEKAVSVDLLKPAFIAKSDSPADSQEGNQAITSKPNLTTDIDRPLRTYANISRCAKKVSFLSPPEKVTGEGVDVATRSSQPFTTAQRERSDQGTRPPRPGRKQRLIAREIF